MQIYLVRHGEKKSELGNPGLTEMGRDQAKKTAKFLANKKVKFIEASPLSRTKETAQIIARPLKLKVRITDLLAERANG